MDESKTKSNQHLFKKVIVRRPWKPITHCPVCQAKVPTVMPPRCHACDCFLRFTRWHLKPAGILELQRRVKVIGFSRDAYDLVFRAIKKAISESKLPETKRQADARAICSAVCDFAHLHFQGKAAEQLQAWGIRDSFDVGTITAALAAAGLFRWTSEDSVESFRDIYKVGDEQWKAIWSRPDENRGYCGGCGYDLRGSPNMICPECGRPN